MKLLDIITNRRSVRRYTDQEVEQKKIDYIMECVRLAPSAVNHQPWKFYVVRSEQKRAGILDLYPANWFKFNPTPVYIVACAVTGEAWVRKEDGKNHADIDVALAFEHIVLAAEEQGLGTCWMCAFDVAGMKKLLDLPEGMEPVAMTPLGYPSPKMAETPRTTRKPIEGIVEEV